MIPVVSFNIDNYLEFLQVEVYGRNKQTIDAAVSTETSNLKKQIEAIKVYQGYNNKVDNRGINFYTLNKEEAKDYGKNVREVIIDTSGMLNKKKDSKIYNELKVKFSKDTGKSFDLLDNSPAGLKTQNEFFNVLKKKGYTGIDFTGFNDNQYIVAFEDTTQPAGEVTAINDQLARINAQLSLFNENKPGDKPGTKRTNLNGCNT